MLSVPTTVPDGRYSPTEAAERLISVGDSFTLVILIVNVFSVHRPPWSVERIRIDALFCASKLKTDAVVSVPPTIANRALSVLPEPLTSV